MMLLMWLDAVSSTLKISEILITQDDPSSLEPFPPNMFTMVILSVSIAALLATLLASTSILQLSLAQNTTAPCLPDVDNELQFYSWVSA